MPAPALTYARVGGSVTLNIDPVLVRGWELRGSATQASPGADWTCNCHAVKVDLPAIADADETFTWSLTPRIPFNEAPTEAAIIAKLQAIFDVAYDLIPSP